jgi:alpha-galactosidase
MIMKFNIFSKTNTLLAELKSCRAPGKSYESCTVSRELLDRAGDLLIIKCAIPIIDIQGYWTPDLFRPVMQLCWRKGFSCAAHRNFPYVTFFNQAQRNRAALGTGNLFDDSVFTLKMNQETGNYDVEIKVSVCPETAAFDLFWDAADREWTQILQDYRAFVRPDWRPDYPAGAWLPVYCTWYAVHAAVEKSWLETQEDEAAAMGFGTFIVDDGWCFDDMKRVSPETIGTWYENIGDWEVSARHLPDFRRHVERARKLGLKYLLWVSPFMVGDKTRFVQEIDCEYLTELHEGYRVFDPADAATARKSMDKMLAVVRENGLDGLKIDFVDAVPQSPDRPRGRTVYHYMKELLDTVKAENPEALIEFRQNYATPAMLDLGTQFRAGDVPFDYVENIHRIAQIRVCLGDGVPVHADPVYWNPGDSDENIARHMICSLAGVPMVSMDLAALPENQKNIMKFWLNFYREHLELFKNGKWNIRYSADHLSFIEVAGAGQKIVFLCEAAAVPAKPENGIVLNLTHQPIPAAGGSKFDCRGARASGDFIPAAGYAVY